jgi:hypothetical protein
VQDEYLSEGTASITAKEFGKFHGSNFETLFADVLTRQEIPTGVAWIMLSEHPHVEECESSVNCSLPINGHFSTLARHRFNICSNDTTCVSSSERTQGHFDDEEINAAVPLSRDI